MKSKRDDPVTGKRAQMLVIVDLAQTNIAAWIDIDLSVGGTNGLPRRVPALWRNEPGQTRKRVEKTDSGCGSEIRGKETVMKIRFPKQSAGKAFRKRCFVRAAPIEAVMQQRDWRVKFGQNPLIIAA